MNLSLSNGQSPKQEYLSRFPINWILSLKNGISLLLVSIKVSIQSSIHAFKPSFST